MDQILEIAALACAAIGFVLLVVRFGGDRVTRSVKALRFRRSLKRLEAVADRWAMELPPRPQRPDEPARRRQLPPDRDS